MQTIKCKIKGNKTDMQMNKNQSYPKFLYELQRTEVWGCAKTPQMPNTTDKKKLQQAFN